MRLGANFGPLACDSLSEGKWRFTISAGEGKFIPSQAGVANGSIVVSPSSSDPKPKAQQWGKRRALATANNSDGVSDSSAVAVASFH
jgi:hypothetical protein